MEGSDRMSKTKRVAIDGMLIALSIILTRFFSIRLTIFGVEGVRIGIGMLPLILAGFMFEPIDALFVGAISDIVGYSISPMGPYIPYFTLTAALKGWIPSAVHKYIFRKSFKFWHIFVSNAVGVSIVSMVLIPYLLHTIFHMPYSFLLIPRAVAFPFYLFLYPFLISLIIKKAWHRTASGLSMRA